MSSSISTSNQPGDRRRVLLFMGTLAVMLALVAGFNAWVDPYYRFRRAGDAAARLGGSTNHVLLTMIEVNKVAAGERAQADVVIVGDSRARKLTAERFVRAGGHAVLNLGIGGGSFEEMVSYLRQQAASLKQGQTLVVTVPLERFAAGLRPDRCLEAPRVANWSICYLLNSEILRPSAELLTAPRRVRPETARLAGAPSSPQAQKAQDAMVYSTWETLFSCYQSEVADRRVAALQGVLAPLQARKVAVIFWCPPLRSDVRQLIGKYGLEPEQARLMQALNKIAPVVDMTAEAGIGATPFTFSDPVHTEDGAMILERVLREGGAGKAD